MISEKVKVIIGDITKLEGYDAVVISTKPELKSNWLDNIGAALQIDMASLDAQVRTMCGKELKEECQKIRNKLGRDLYVGEAIVTSAPNLPFNHIIHTVVPDANESGQDVFLLESCYKNILSCAMENGIKTLAIPCIGINHNHYDAERAAEVAVEIVTNFIKTYDEEFESVAFVISEKASDKEKIKEKYEKCLSSDVKLPGYLTVKIKIDSFDEEVASNYIKDFMKEKFEISEDRKIILSLIDNKMIWDLFYTKVLRKTMIPILGNWLTKIFRIVDFLNSDDDSNEAQSLIEKYLNDIRLKFKGDNNYIFIDLKNINIENIINDLLPLIKNKRITELIKSVNDIISENEKIAVFNSVMDFILSEELIQKIYKGVIESKSDEKIITVLRKIDLKLGTIQCSKL